MDPLSAFSLAGTVLQVVDVSAKLVKGVWEIAAAGATVENLQITAQTKRLRDLLDRLESASHVWSSHSSTEDEDLLALCNEGREISSHLLSILDGCRSKAGEGNNGQIIWSTFWKAVKTAWKAATITDLQAQLDRINQRVHLLVTVKYFTQIATRIETLESLIKSYSTPQIGELVEICNTIKEYSLNPNGANVDEVRDRLLLQTSQQGVSLVNGDEAILGQLRFFEMEARAKVLSDNPAHGLSYRWLEDSTSADSAGKAGQLLANFKAWLESADPFYWISGKPGSGKSTLMKSLFENSSTRERLMKWTRNRQLLLGAYYFWEVGKIELLRSRCGLLRTLLYSILRQKPHLIRMLYSELYSLGTQTDGDKQIALSSINSSGISKNELDLLSKLDQASQILAAEDTYICLFIDGLDEYEGKPDDIIELINTLTKLFNTKVCASSRPDLAFVQAYSSNPNKLYMEHFNLADITAYVRDALHRYAHSADNDERTLAESLIVRVGEESKGVFLWVRLVVQELKEGLRNQDAIRDIEKRFDMLPKELEGFFEMILDRVDVFYQEHCATMLLVLLRMSMSMSVMACWCLSEGDRELTGSHEISPASHHQIKRRRKVVESRLNTYCKGLLEVQSVDRVNFLHKTVRDFLQRGTVVSRLDNWKPKPFDADELICKALLGTWRSLRKVKIGTSDDMDMKLFEWHCRQMPNSTLARQLSQAKNDIEAHHARTIAGISLTSKTIYIPSGDETTVVSAAEWIKDHAKLAPRSSPKLHKFKFWSKLKIGRHKN